MEERTEDFLFRELHGLRRSRTSAMLVFGEEGEWDPLARTEGALDALAAIGAISDDEAGLWRTRFRAAMDGVSEEEAADEAVRRRAGAYVTGLLARTPAETRPALEASSELEDVLNTLHHVGVLGERDVSGWFDRLAERLGRPQPPEDDGEPGARLSELRRVVVGPPERRGGVRVVGFEVYDDAVVLRWHLARLAPDAEGHVPRLPDEVEGEEAARRAREPFFLLHDDCDTAYRMHSGGAGSASSPSGSRVWTGNAVFTPTVAADARRLWAATEAFRFEVVL